MAQPMTPERWRQVEALYESARAYESGERSRFLASACAGDDDLRREIESLLAHDTGADEDSAGEDGTDEGSADRGADDFLSPATLAAMAYAMEDADRIPSGHAFGAYQVREWIGAGAMGEVYRARDLRLGRDIALKVLPRHLTIDRERVARFEREARVLGALNHPHVGAIHGVAEADGLRALILELVEGPTLAEKLAAANASGTPPSTSPPTSPSTGLPQDEALTIARQIASALEAAHDKGIIHRDLKPANIKITPAGMVKVLDFGLASAGRDGALHLGDAPTVSLSGTRVGTLLGTAAYMSPEQARGHVVDKRTDIWAFGCVLYEMLTGRRAFEADGITDTVVAIITNEPDWTPIRDGRVRSLIERCLKKDPASRMRDIGEARLAIDTILGYVADDRLRSARPQTPSSTPPSTSAEGRRVDRMTLLVASAALGGGMLIGAGLITALPPSARPAPAAVTRVMVDTPNDRALLISGFDRDLALSRDGRTLVYRGAGGQGGPLIARALDQLQWRTLSGITNARQPFLSADSRWIGFIDSDRAEIKKVATTGGPAASIGRIVGLPRGASWGEDDRIVFASTDPATGLLSIAAAGGVPTVLTTPNLAEREGDHVFPSVLPGGRGVLFTIAGEQADQARIALLDPATKRYTTVIRGGSDAQYVESGHLVYATVSGTLMAVPFDLARLEAAGDPVPVIQSVSVTPSGSANYAVSAAGTLIYATNPVNRFAEPRRLVWVDRQGRETPVGQPERGYGQIKLSPDGTRVALTIFDDESDLWVLDLASQRLTPVTRDRDFDQTPNWTPDGRRIVFTSSYAGAPNIYVKAADGTGPKQRLTSSPYAQFVQTIAPDGTRVLSTEITPTTHVDIVAVPLTGAVNAASGGAGAGVSTEPGVHAVLRTPFDEQSPAVSPNGRFLAYESNESGRSEIYVKSYPDIDGGLWRISKEGGMRPVWGRDGRELFYLVGGNRLMVVPVVTEGAGPLVAAAPVMLFDRGGNGRELSRWYDVSPDGRRFLMISARPSTAARPPMILVLNWFEELKTLAARTP